MYPLLLPHSVLRKATLLQHMLNVVTWLPSAWPVVQTLVQKASLYPGSYDPGSGEVDKLSTTTLLLQLVIYGNVELVERHLTAAWEHFFQQCRSAPRFAREAFNMYVESTGSVYRSFDRLGDTPSVRPSTAAQLAEQLERADMRAVIATYGTLRAALEVLPCGNAINLPDEQCAICHEDIGDGAEVARLWRCGHTFHGECIRRWLAQSPSEFCNTEESYSPPSCPLCRLPCVVPDRG